MYQDANIYNVSDIKIKMTIITLQDGVESRT